MSSEDLQISAPFMPLFPLNIVLTSLDGRSLTRHHRTILIDGDELCCGEILAEV